MSIAGRRARDVGAERHRVAGRGGGGDRVSIRHACIACMQAVAADGAGLSLARGARLREPVFATDPRSDELEELQCTLGESPCIDALSADGAVLVTDLWSAGSARRWPTFAAAPVQGGVRAMFFDSGPDGCCRRPRRAESVPRPGPGPLTGGELADALAYGDAALVLALDRRGGISPGWTSISMRSSPEGEPRCSGAIRSY